MHPAEAYLRSLPSDELRQAVTRLDRWFRAVYDDRPDDVQALALIADHFEDGGAARWIYWEGLVKIGAPIWGPAD